MRKRAQGLSKRPMKGQGLACSMSYPLQQNKKNTLLEASGNHQTTDHNDYKPNVHETCSYLQLRLHVNAAAFNQ